ncbi:DUF4381 domain-containing protein [Aliiglaciecola sp.]|nr:DUF4381 domain-containing protein [Aliiglaciecola sp.]
MNPLDQLKDIHLPQTVSPWPLAWGWWVLIVIALGLLILGVLWIRRYVTIRKVKKAALLELSQYDTSEPSIQAKVNGLLKRVCMHYYPDISIASMHGSDWTEFLTTQLPVNHQSTFKQDFEKLQAGLYCAATQRQDIPCVALATLWIETCLPVHGASAVANNTREVSHV